MSATSHKWLWSEAMSKSSEVISVPFAKVGAG